MAADATRAADRGVDELELLLQVRIEPSSLDASDVLSPRRSRESRTAASAASFQLVY
jgi:hypothetical protein